MDETTTPDRDLLRRLAAKDEAAVQDFLERYWARVYRVSYYLLGDPGAAEDAAQETFVAALRGAAQLEDPRALRAWLFRIAENQAKKHQRSASRREAREQGPELQARARARRSGPVGQELEREELGAVVRDELQALSPKLRLALSLRYLEGLSLEQVADVLEVPRKTVSSRIRRGLDDLRGRLEPQTVGLAAAGWPALVLAEALAGVEVPPPPAPVELSAALGPAAPDVAAPAARTVVRAARRGGLSGAALTAGVLIAGFAAAALWFALDSAGDPVQVGQVPAGDDAGPRPAPPPVAPQDAEAGASSSPASGENPAPEPGVDAAPPPVAPPPAPLQASGAEVPTLDRRYDLGEVAAVTEARLFGDGLAPWDNGGPLASVAVHPGAEWLISGDVAGALKVWDRASGQVRATLEPAHPGFVATVDVSRDGARAVSVGGGVLRLWDIERRELLAEHAVSRSSVGARFTPTGELLVAVGGTVELWTRIEEQAPTRLRRFGETPEADLNCLALSADGARLAVGGEDEYVRVYDVATAHEVARFRCSCDPGDGSRVLSCALSADGSQVATTGYRGHAAVYDVTRQARVAAGHEGDFMGESLLTADGALLTVGLYGAHRWTPGDEERLTPTELKLGPASGYPAALALDPTLGRIVIGTSGGALVELRASDGALQLPPPSGADAAERESAPRAVHADVVTALALDPLEAQAASASLDGTVRVWDLASGTCTRVLEGEPDTWATAVAYHPSGRWLVSGHFRGDVGARVWDPRTGEQLAAFPGRWVTCLSVHPERPWVVTGGREVVLYDLLRREEVRRFGDLRQVTAVAISPDGARLAVATSDVIRYKSWTATPGQPALRVFDLASGEALFERPLEDDDTWGLAWRPDGAGLISGHEDGALRAWSATLAPEATLRGHGGRIRTVAFSADGGRFYVASHDRRVSEWSASTLEPLRVFSGEPGAARALAVGRATLLTAGDGKLPRAWPLR